MIRANFHTHTNYCDGQDSVAEMAEEASVLGMTALGFSGHATNPYDPCGMSDVPHYVSDVLAMKEQYKGRLEIYLGVEDDLHGPRPAFERDYTIGSAHFVEAGGVHYAVDESPEAFQRAIREGFGSDPYALTRAYFENVAQLRTRTRCDFVGHFDLVAKYNDGLFDEDDPRYTGPALEALEVLCRDGGVLEINTGAMARGCREIPYPIPRFLRAAQDFGAAIVLSSDCHDRRKLLYAFDTAAELARTCGFRTARVLTAKGWQEEPL